METDRLLDVRQVIDKCGVGRTSIYRLMEESGFPQPRRITPQRVKWIESEIDEWMKTLPKEDVT